MASMAIIKNSSSAFKIKFPPNVITNFQKYMWGCILHIILIV